MDSGLDTAKIKDYFVNASIRAANMAARAGLEHIRQHAPVRKIFRGTSYSSIGKLPVLQQPARFGTPNSAGYASPHRTGRIARQYRTRVPEEQGKITRPGQTEEDVQTHRQRLGHANSVQPVFRFKNKGFNTLVTGDFRRVQNGELVAATPSIVRQRGNRLVDVPYAGPPVTARDLIAPGGKQLLTSRGSFEVKSGRATFVDKLDGKSRIGGRLKSELRTIDAAFDGDHVWAYVISPTVDPETGYPYPRAQEFGSAHNRPHPFMRPGLHETRNELVSAVQ
ncbi:MAG TPA: hypothetical protein VFP22_02170, partial [Candidatus Limnocylindrales bacterium]|nr:hypothetical protein [Candidatus Limnocylindrales bacterium]